MRVKEQLERARLAPVNELFAKITEAKKALFTFEQEKILGKLKDVSQIRQKKREIARLATILDELVSREIEHANR